MCGIVGYVGSRDAVDFLIAGLRRLEYRGYDSAGIATLNGPAQFHLVKSVGRIDNLAQEVGVEKPVRQHRHWSHALGDAWPAKRG